MIPTELNMVDVESLHPYPVRHVRVWHRVYGVEWVIGHIGLCPDRKLVLEGERADAKLLDGILQLLLPGPFVSAR